MPVGSLAPRRVSEDEYLSLDETRERMELIDGEVYVPPSPTRIHQHAIGVLYRALSQWAEDQAEPYFVGLAPLDVRLGPSRIVQPDIFLTRGPVDMQAAGPFTRIPAVCVEVMSTNRVYDRVTKRYLYAEAGVTEYWLVDPTSEEMEILHGPGLRAQRDITGDFPGGLLEDLAGRLAIG